MEASNTATSEGSSSIHAYAIIVPGKTFMALLNRGLTPVFITGMTSLIGLNEICAYAEKKVSAENGRTLGKPQNQKSKR